MMSWLRAAALVVVLNAVFLLLCLGARLAPREHYLQRIRQAFAAGDLGTEDYLWPDARRGWNQVSDCDRLQTFITAEDDLLLSTIAPRVHQNPGWRDGCALLAEASRLGGAIPGHYWFRYSRYWHGAVPVTAALLGPFSLRQARLILMLGVFASGLALLLASRHAEPRVATFGVAVSATALLFWGIPYYDPSITHGPGDFVLLGGLAVMVAMRSRLRQAPALILFSAVYAALVVFFEAWVAQFPIAAALLFPAAYLIARGEVDERAAFRLGVLAMGGFALGAVITVGVQQALAAAVAGTGEVAGFSRQLASYSQPEGSLAERLGALAYVFMKFPIYARVLTYDSVPASMILVAATTAAWWLAVRLAWRGRGQGAFWDLLPCCLGTLAVAAWVVVFQGHTGRHMMSMSRLLLVPISLGWAALALQLTVARRAPTVTAAAADAEAEQRPLPVGS